MTFVQQITRFLVMMVFVCISTVAHAQSDNLTAFENFVYSGRYTDADFYLTNGYVTAADVDPSQLFFHVLMKSYDGDAVKNGRKIETLFNYLAKFGAIDFNRVFTCGRAKDGDKCLLLNDLVSLGTKPQEMAWFVARGLDLNQRLPEFVPATLPLVIRLASSYTLTDLNWFVANGMVLGDEAYSLEELINFRDRFLYRSSYKDQLSMPSNYLNLGDQNLLDVLVVVLATPTDLDSVRESHRRKVICDFITHAAAAYVPSYDYLLHVLDNIVEFRGGNIGVQKTGRNQATRRNSVYQPFPTSCVLLVQAMAGSHAQLDQVISAFAAKQDVVTANWLISIKKNRG